MNPAERRIPHGGAIYGILATASSIAGTIRLSSRLALWAIAEGDFGLDHCRSPGTILATKEWLISRTSSTSMSP
jgi:hypothetical protein